MSNKLGQEIERRFSVDSRNVNRLVQEALTEGGKPRPKPEADARLRKSCEQEFRDRNNAHALCDEVDKALKRRHGPNPIVSDTTAEFRRQLRRRLWLDAESRQDELVARLTAGQPDLMGGSHFPRPTGANDRIGWAITNTGLGDVLVDGNGCAVHRFKLAPTYDGDTPNPQLFPGQPFVGPNRVRRTSVPFDLQVFKDHLRSGSGEANLQHMYLDSEGNVTVGVGHLLRTVQEALAVNFIEVGAGTGIVAPTTAADPDNVRSVFQLLTDEAAKGGPIDIGTNIRTLNFHGRFYHEYSRILVPGKGAVDLQLFPSESLRLLDHDVTEFEKQLRSSNAFPDFNSYPFEVRFALMDMAFNLGAYGVRDKYPEFTRAIRVRNWLLAATETNRFQLGSARNNEIKTKLLEAGRREPFFHDPTCSMKGRLEEWSVPGFFG